MTQTEAASTLGVSQTALSYWESGKREPGLDHLATLASTYGTTVGELFEEEPQNSETSPEVEELLAVARRVDRALKKRS